MADHAATTDDSSDEGGAGVQSLEEPTLSQQIAQTVGKMANIIKTEGRISTGDLAELRRISPDKPFTPALWKLLICIDAQQPVGGLKESTYERRMATLAMGMAFCARLHGYQMPLGRALANAGWSELRFVRLMEARGEKLEVHIRRMAQYLASKSQAANWTDVAWLLLGQDWSTAEETRLRISRSYYGVLYTKEQEQSSSS
jgi:CRISPR system Cascade subunit CasB